MTTCFSRSLIYGNVQYEYLYDVIKIGVGFFSIQNDITQTNSVTHLILLFVLCRKKSPAVVELVIRQELHNRKSCDNSGQMIFFTGVQVIISNTPKKKVDKGMCSKISKIKHHIFPHTLRINPSWLKENM